MRLASGQRESATNRLGEHGGMGFGPMWHSAKFSISRLIVSGLSVSVTPDAHLNRRMSMTPSKQSDIKPAIRAALYARISTLNRGQDPEVQLRELRDYCQRRGFTITHEYVDKGISGSREKRPALDRLMADCRKRLVDAVVVYRYDRFARSLRQLVNSLEEV